MNGVNTIQTIGGSDVASLKRPLNAGLLDDENFAGDLIPAKKPSEAGDLNMGDSDKVVDVYQVPEKVVGLVIGKGGSEIRQIQQNSGCRVQMDPDNQTVNGFRNCTIEGSAEQVSLARQMINQVIARNQTGSTGTVTALGGEITDEMLIPADKIGLVIGKGGETIRTVQEQAGLRSINVVQDTSAPTGQPKPLRMVGTPSAIELAKSLVANVMNNTPVTGLPVRSSGASYGGGHEAQAKGEVIVPRLSAGMIIGRGGEMIKRLAQETGTKIQFKPDDNPTSEDRVAVIMGTRDQIYRATERITEIVNRAIKNNGSAAPISTGSAVTAPLMPGQSVFWLHVPANKCGLVIGKGGENIKQIERETGASCGLAAASEQKKEDEKVFEIRGTPLQIHHASHLVKIKVGEIAPNTPVPPLQGHGYPQQAQQQQQYAQNGFQAAAAVGYAQPQQQQFAVAQQGWPQNGGLQQADVYQQAAAVAAVQTQAAQPAAVQADPNAPVVNPATGAPDYSAQWAAYYRSIGLMDQAAMVENQMRRNQATSGDAQPQAQQYYPHPQ